MPHIVLARPDQLHRRRHRRRDVHRLEHELHVRAAPERAPGRQRMHAHRRARNIEPARDQRLQDIRALIAGPDLGAAVTDHRDRRQRLHRRVREVRHAVFDVQRARDALRIRRLAFLAHHAPLVVQALSLRRGDRRRIHAVQRPCVPFDAEHPGAPTRLPVAVGDHRDRRLELEHAAHPGHRQRAFGIAAAQPAAELRAAHHHRGQHAGDRDVDAETRAAVDLRRRVDARVVVPDQPPVLARLEGEPVRHLQRRRRRREFAPAGAPRTVTQAHLAVARDAIGERRLPFARRRRAQHLAQRRAGGAQRVEIDAQRIAAAGDHGVVLRVDVIRVRLGELALQRTRIDAELLRDQRREPGHHTLPHLGLGDREHHAAVGQQLQEGIGLQYALAPVRPRRRRGSPAATERDREHHAGAGHRHVAQETAPVQRAHDAASAASSAAARWIARRIRG